MKDLTTNIFTLVRKLEIAGVKRAAILELVKPEVEKIDGARKDLRESLTAQIKTLDCVSAVKVCNMISQTIQGADSATTSRLNRRRVMLKTLLGKAFSEYDFDTVTTKAGGIGDCKIFETKIGDKNVREAIDLMAAIKRIKSLGFDTPEVTREALVEGIKDGLETVVTEKDIEDEDDDEESVQDILSRIKDGLTAEQKEGQEQKEAQA